MEVPFFTSTKYYDNTIVGLFLQQIPLSLPGERIGYLVMPDELSDADDVIAAASVANRILGFVNAPSLMQRVVARCGCENRCCLYNRNREALYGGLKALGYSCIKPEGAFTCL